jgi:hypothetical protein
MNATEANNRAKRSFVRWRTSCVIRDRHAYGD